LASNRHSQVKNKQKERKTTKDLIESPFDDNPFLRQEADTVDSSGEGKPVSMLRLLALQHARKMPISDDEPVA
jgi:hypothetical protein